MVLNLNTHGFSPHFLQICKRDYGFQAMQGCNDCVFDCHGNLWITAPAGSIAPAAYKRSMEVRIIVQFTFFLYMTCPNTLQKMVNRKNSQIQLSMYATANYWFEELSGRNCFQMFVWKQKCHVVGHSRGKSCCWGLLKSSPTACILQWL